jgi:hypothetical protein
MLSQYSRDLTITILLVNMHVVPFPILLILLILSRFIQAIIKMGIRLPCGARLLIQLTIIFFLLIELTTMGIRSIETMLIVFRPIALMFISLTLVSMTMNHGLSVMGSGRMAG